MASSAKKRMAYVRSFRKNAKRRTRRSKRNPVSLMTYTRKAKTNPRRRRTYRRNPWPLGGISVNPRRKRSQRRYRRNPAIAGVSFPSIEKIVFATAGFAATGVLEGFIRGWLPATIINNAVGRYAIKIASVVGITLGARQVVSRDKADMVTLGGTLYVATGVYNEFIKPMIPGLGSFVPQNQIGMGAFVPQNRIASGLSGMPGGNRWVPQQVFRPRRG